MKFIPLSLLSNGRKAVKDCEGWVRLRRTNRVVYGLKDDNSVKGLRIGL